jgi:hypothetical protein
MNNCPSVKTQCTNNNLVKSVKKLIDQLGSEDMKDIIPVTKKDLREMTKALDLYMVECNRCARETSNDYICMRAAAENLQRRIPMFSKTVYPWKNYDWNYSNYISNNYMPRHTGATRSSSIQALYDNVLAIGTVLGGLIDDPIPNKYSRAAVRSRYSDYPPFEECSDPKCMATQDIKNALSSQLYKPPTTDKFLREKKLHGKYSSSYYVKIGSCPRRDIKTIKDCEKRGYTWSPSIFGKLRKSAKKRKEAKKAAEAAAKKAAEAAAKKAAEAASKSNTNTPTETIPKITQPKIEKPKTDPGSCSQPRYIFIDNSSKPMLNGSNMQGILPSLANDIVSIMPEKIFAAAMGNSLRNNFEIQQCPSTDEAYTNYKQSRIQPWITNICVLLIILLIWVLVGRS